MEARVTLVALADAMIQQIETIVVYREPTHSMHGVEAVYKMLNQLAELPPRNVYDLLLIRNGSGWSYASMFVMIDHQGVLARYIALLNWLHNNEIASEKIFDLLNCKDLKEGQIFSRKADVKNKQAYLDLLCQLKDEVGLSAVQVLLETPNKKKTIFLQDILACLLPAKNKASRPEYCALLCYMIVNQLVSSKSLQLFVGCRAIIARYILSIPEVEAKQLMLEKALQTDSSLGQIFLHPPASNRWLAEFQVELNKIKPPIILQEEKIDMQMAAEEKEASAECDAVRERSHKKSWFGFFQRKSSDEGMELQTFKVFGSRELMVNPDQTSHAACDTIIAAVGKK